MVVPPREKLLQTIQLVTRSLEDQNLTKCIIYFPTCAMVDYFFPLLSHIPQLATHKLISLHGQLPPSARQKNFALFCSMERPSVLLTTDVAARGLDVPNVDLVIQLDPPQDPKNFAHRCGRAGRAGRAGKAVVLLSEGREEEYIELLRVRGIPVEPIPPLIVDEGWGVDELVARFRTFVLKDRAFHDKVPFQGGIELIVGDESFSVLCTGLFEASGDVYFSN
jgi:ATP-dependent RNA helicase DDX55/SPB4